MTKTPAAPAAAEEETARAAAPTADLPAAAASQSPAVRRRNFWLIQIDAIAVGLSAAASPLLPVFLARLGASNAQVGLLTSMPGLTGLLFAIPIGTFLQNRRNVVPWFGVARLLYILCYALTGLAPFILLNHQTVQGTLLIWAAATIPQTMLAVCFSVVMSTAAGPQGRFEWMSWRWSILGISTAITALVASQVLARLSFPFNYQVVFLGLSVGGFLSFYFSTRIVIPDNRPLARAAPGVSPLRRLQQYLSATRAALRRNPAFVSFAGKRFVYLFGNTLALPILPLYFVRQIQASDSQIALVSTAQAGVLIVGYQLWVWILRRRGARFVLLTTTFGCALYPALVALTQDMSTIILYAGLASIIQAGMDLVFFDELMKTVPSEASAAFVSIAQTTQYFAAIVAPLVGTLLADQIGFSGALLVSAGIRLLGFLLFTV